MTDSQQLESDFVDILLGNLPYEIYPKAHNYSSSDIGKLLIL